MIKESFDKLIGLYYSFENNKNTDIPDKNITTNMPNTQDDNLNQEYDKKEYIKEKLPEPKIVQDVLNAKAFEVESIEEIKNDMSDDDFIYDIKVIGYAFYISQKERIRSILL